MKRSVELEQVREALGARFNLNHTKSSTAELVASLIQEADDRRALDHDPKYLARQAPEAVASALRAAKKKLSQKNALAAKASVDERRKALNRPKLIAEAERMGWPDKHEHGLNTALAIKSLRIAGKAIKADHVRKILKAELAKRRE